MSRPSLATRVADEYPDHFSLLVHHPDGTATVHLTGEVPESLMQEFADKNVSVVGDAAFSESEAQAVTAKVHSRLIDGFGSTDLLTSVDNHTGEVSVVTKSARDAAVAVRFLEPLAAELDESSVWHAADRAVISTDPSLQFELER